MANKSGSPFLECFKHFFCCKPHYSDEITLRGIGGADFLGRGIFGQEERKTIDFR